MHRPELHLAPANGIPSASYRKLNEALAVRYEVHAVPELGTDPRFPIEPTCTGLIEQLVDSIRTRCRGPVVGVGHSLGAVTTFMAAYRHPELFSRVVLLDPPFVDPMAGFVLGLTRAARRAQGATTARKTRACRETWPSREAARASLANEELFRAFDPDCFEDYLRHGLVDDGEGVRLAIPAATEAAIFGVAPPPRWASYADELRVPGTVLIAGSRGYAMRESTERFARRFGMRHALVLGGHMFPLERPAEAAARILHELDGLRKGVVAA